MEVPNSVPQDSGSTKLSPSDRRSLYAARHYLDLDVEKKLGLRIPFDVYFQDPAVAKSHPDLTFDKDCFVPWEPGLADGPTSSRFAVVDYDADKEAIEPPARWDARKDRFVDEKGNILDASSAASAQFHQVSVWAILQRGLDFFESGFALGRSISWAFEGNRLIVVPHAGTGQNAFYDRKSKSLQFYYFKEGDRTIQTCLSTDIVTHEFGHAVLDGIRPHFMEGITPETAAFHEFIGDLTAVLITLRNNAFRARLIKETKGDLNSPNSLSSLAEEFGKAVEGRPYLRSARNDLKMSAVANDQRPHYMSQVLTGAMFEILIRLSKYYMEKRKRTVSEAFWNTIQRMQGVAIQPLDLLPPVDVTFRDYALAVLRSDEIASPTDPDGYRGMMLDVFIEKEILNEEDREELTKPRHIFERLDLDVFHNVDRITASKANAYRFLDDNRRKLFIPWNVDITVADLCTAQKLTRQARRLPDQHLLQYIWREDVLLEGERFGRFAGQTASMLCGGTLALDQNGEQLAWNRKPGSASVGESAAALDEQQSGLARRAAFLDALARRIRTGRIGTELGGEKGLLAKGIAPFTATVVDAALRFELSPHFGIHDDKDDPQGGRAWQISS